MNGDLQSLLGRLNPLCRRAFEIAAGLCVSRTHYAVELEHVVLAFLDLPGSDIEKILAATGIEPADVRGELNERLEQIKRGNTKTPRLAPEVEQLLAQAWLFSTLRFRIISVRSAAVLLGAMTDEDLADRLCASAPSLRPLREVADLDRIQEIIADSVEADESMRPQSGSALPPEGTAGPARGTVSKNTAPNDVTGNNAGITATLITSALDRFTVDLVAEAQRGCLDPVYEREDEIRQVIDILTRRRQNNPILVGDAGVGKTAVAEGFALRVAVGDVPDGLRQISVRALDLGLLEAGTGVRGEFETRLRAVISEVEAEGGNVVLFVDEAHNLVGAGGSEGRGDAANLLKPALASGRLRTIAATTWAEYKRYFEKDPALARRFQAVRIDEPGEEAAVSMLRGVVPTLEDHHGVRVLDAAVVDAVRLSQRFIPDRKLPAKAISVLDTAAARVALAQQSRPTAIERLSQRIRRMDRELESLEKEVHLDESYRQRVAALETALADLTDERRELERRWEEERTLVLSINNQEARLEQLASEENDESPSIETAVRELTELERTLAELQRDGALVPRACDSRVVAEVISSWTGIPSRQMLRDEIDVLLSLPDRISQRIIGQPEAIRIISSRIQTARAGLENPRKPRGVFLLVGPTGVGKTETAIALAELLYGGERNLVTLHMSEFQEPHSVATLKGAPPGYVGYGSGGLLTETVRRRPYCAVLLDEVERAHPDVLEIFFQVFDKGILEDGEGIPVDFRHAVILLTTNLSGEIITDACEQAPGERPDADMIIKSLRAPLTAHLGAPLLGRIEIVPYYPLGQIELREIVRLKLEAVADRVRQTYLADVTFDESLVESLAEQCYRSDSGARRVEYLLNRKLLPELSTQILQRMGRGSPLATVQIHLTEDGELVSSLSK
jgi:type VI secretion system protein VasG